MRESIAPYHDFGHARPRRPSSPRVSMRGETVVCSKGHVKLHTRVRGCTKETDFMMFFNFVMIVSFSTLTLARCLRQLRIKFVQSFNGFSGDLLASKTIYFPLHTTHRPDDSTPHNPLVRRDVRHFLADSGDEPRCATPEACSDLVAAGGEGEGRRRQGSRSVWRVLTV